MSVYINSIATANPKFKIAQQDSVHFIGTMAGYSETEQRRLKLLYQHSGIKYRYSVLEDFTGAGNFFSAGNTPFIADRLKVFQQEAMPLAHKASIQSLSEAGINPADITHIITVSCTGMSAPGLDIALIRQLGLNHSVERYSINFMGCYAALIAMRHARSIIQGNPLARVLLVCVELCSIHYLNRTDESYIISNTLFSDGAAAMVLSSEKKNALVEVEQMDCVLLPDGEEEMSWQIKEDAFEMIISDKIPDLLAHELPLLIPSKAKEYGYDLNAFRYAMHPGGRRILDYAHKALHIEKEKLASAYKVLEEFGNMSSPTILFVLKEELKLAASKDRICTMAFGPGLAIELAFLNVC